MSPSKEFDPLFQEMKNVELSKTAERELLVKIQKKAARKRKHLVPTILSGLAVAAVLTFCVLFATNSVMFENIATGSSGTEKIVFAGSEENWTIEYVITYPKEGWGKEVFTITYIGDEEPPESIDYLIESISGGSNGTNVSLNENQRVTGSKESNGAKVMENEELEATITWLGKTETITLRSQ